MINVIVCHMHGKRRVVLSHKHWLVRAACRVPLCVSPFIVEFARVGTNTTDYVQMYWSLEPIKHEWRGFTRRLHARLRA